MTRLQVPFSRCKCKAFLPDVSSQRADAVESRRTRGAEQELRAQVNQLLARVKELCAQNSQLIGEKSGLETKLAHAQQVHILYLHIPALTS